MAFGRLTGFQPRCKHSRQTTSPIKSSPIRPICIKMKENRAEPRVNMNLPIVAWWEDDAGNRRFSYGKLEDISNTGLRFRSREEIPIGTKLLLRTSMGEYVGKIVRSSQ